MGPNRSADALPVAEVVIGPAGIPTVSFSASSPMLTDVADNDFMFRTAVSDALQGPVLSRVARERGFENVGVVHVDDAWGFGLAEAIDDAWGGAIEIVAAARGKASYLEVLRDSAKGGAQVLIVIAFENMAVTMVSEAIENGIYSQFIFGGGAKRPGIVRAIGGDRLGGMVGTGPASAPESAVSVKWEAAYVAEYGVRPVRAYVKETYDATIALALAAQAAGRLDGPRIRDRMRAVTGPPGTVVVAGPEGVAWALRILAEGGEIDYDGASSGLDWDENGDLRRGHVGVWKFTADERIEEVEAVPFER